MTDEEWDIAIYSILLTYLYSKRSLFTMSSLRRTWRRSHNHSPQSYVGACEPRQHLKHLNGDRGG